MENKQEKKQEQNKIFAQFNDKTIRVYQAFRDEIADEAVALGKFGPHFRTGRMSWIKPSFLWMMYRSGWSTKKGQERILAIDMEREGFNIILMQAVLSSFDKDIYGTYEKWKLKFESSEVRCQWDPDRDVYGNPLKRRAIQLGLSGNILKRYKEEWIIKIIDITNYVVNMRESIKNGNFIDSMLPTEKEYPVDSQTKIVLGIWGKLEKIPNTAIPTKNTIQNPNCITTMPAITIPRSEDLFPVMPCSAKMATLFPEICISM